MIIMASLPPSSDVNRVTKSKIHECYRSKSTRMAMLHVNFGFHL